ncbi:hypothetical protein JMUB6875_10250 [Nocardia sp. JMUB6875]
MSAWKALPTLRFGVLPDGGSVVWVGEDGGAESTPLSVIVTRGSFGFEGTPGGQQVQGKDSRGGAWSGQAMTPSWRASDCHRRALRSWIAGTRMTPPRRSRAYSAVHTDAKVRVPG